MWTSKWKKTYYVEIFIDRFGTIGITLTYLFSQLTWSLPFPLPLSLSMLPHQKKNTKYYRLVPVYLSWTHLTWYDHNLTFRNVELVTVYWKSLKFIEIKNKKSFWTKKKSLLCKVERTLYRNESVERVGSTVLFHFSLRVPFQFGIETPLQPRSSEVLFWFSRTVPRHQGDGPDLSRQTEKSKNRSFPRTRSKNYKTYGVRWKTSGEEEWKRE